VSARPVEVKKRRRVAKALRKGRLPAYIDLVEYLLDRKMLPTKRYALLAIDNGYVKADSHPLRTRYVPADLRGRIMVVSPNAER